MADGDVKQIKIGDKTYNIKDSIIRPKITECYKILTTKGGGGYGNYGVLDPSGTNYHIFAAKLDGIGMMLLGSKALDFTLNSGTENKSNQIHCFGGYDNSGSFVALATLIHHATTANRFRFYGSIHSVDNNNVNSSYDLENVGGVI